MIGYPLDSHVVFNDGVPEYDRAISSAPLRELIKRLFSDGVLPDVATNMLVQYIGTTRVSGTIDGDVNTYNVVVNAGFGICNGCMKLQENFYGLTMDIANTVNPRIDTVVLRLNDNDAVRSCEFFIVQGEPASTPVAPQLTRNSSIWEIGLANLYKPATVSSVNPVVVTDTRFDTSRCGVISSISEFDTTAIYNQVQDDVEHFKNMTEEDLTNWFIAQQNAFSTWFNDIRGQLSEDVAGNLQNQIDDLFQQDVYRLLERTISSVASQPLTSNPIPTSWQVVNTDVEYTNGGYRIKANGAAGGYGIFRAFDNIDSTGWRSGLSGNPYMDIELPSNVIIHKVRIDYTAPSGSTMKIQSSTNGSTWVDEYVTTDHLAVTGSEIVLSNSPNTKYLRVVFNTTNIVNVSAFKITNYSVNTRIANYTLANLSTLIDGQIVRIRVNEEHDATGIISNTLNGLPVEAILQAGKKYQLVYETTKYSIMEVG